MGFPEMTLFNISALAIMTAIVFAIAITGILSLVFYAIRKAIPMYLCRGVFYLLIAALLGTVAVLLVTNGYAAIRIYPGGQIEADIPGIAMLSLSVTGCIAFLIGSFRSFRNLGKSRRFDKVAGKRSEGGNLRSSSGNRSDYPAKASGKRGPQVPAKRKAAAEAASAAAAAAEAQPGSLMDGPSAETAYGTDGEPAWMDGMENGDAGSDSGAGSVAAVDGAEGDAGGCSAGDPGTDTDPGSDPGSAADPGAEVRGRHAGGMKSVRRVSAGREPSDPMPLVSGNAGSGFTVIWSDPVAAGIDAVPSAGGGRELPVDSVYSEAAGNAPLMTVLLPGSDPKVSGRDASDGE